MRGQNLHYDIAKALEQQLSHWATQTTQEKESCTTVLAIQASSVYVPSFLVEYQSLVAAEDYRDQNSDRRLCADRLDPIAESTAVAPYANCCLWCSYSCATIRSTGSPYSIITVYLP